MAVQYVVMVKVTNILASSTTPIGMTAVVQLEGQIVIGMKQGMIEEFSHSLGLQRDYCLEKVMHRVFTDGATNAIKDI